MNIEETILTGSLPCNSIAMLLRLKELLEENNTNCLESARTDPRVKGVLWLMMSQTYGQLANIDMMEEYGNITEAMVAAVS